MNKVKAAVFASGTGSNFQAMMEDPALPCDIVRLVCDKPGAPVIGKAENYGLNTFVFSANDYENKATYEQEIVDVLRQDGIEWIFLAGYMRLLGETLLNQFEGKIVNIHPSLLPAFPGKDAVGQAYRAGVKVTGVTVHFVDEGMDTGPIIAQEAVRIYENDTVDSLHRRIQEVEHRLYPNVIKELLQK